MVGGLHWRGLGSGEADCRTFRQLMQEGMSDVPTFFCKRQRLIKMSNG